MNYQDVPLSRGSFILLTIDTPTSVRFNGQNEVEYQAGVWQVSIGRAINRLEVDLDAVSKIEYSPVSVERVKSLSGEVVLGPLTNAEMRGTPVAVSGPLTDTQLRASSIPIIAAGPAAHDAAVSGNPVINGAYAHNGLPSAVSADGDVVRLVADRQGQLRVRKSRQYYDSQTTYATIKSNLTARFGTEGCECSGKVLMGDGSGNLWTLLVEALVWDGTYWNFIGVRGDNGLPAAMMLGATQVSCSAENWGASVAGVARTPTTMMIFIGY